MFFVIKTMNTYRWFFNGYKNFFCAYLQMDQNFFEWALYLKDDSCPILHFHNIHHNYNSSAICVVVYVP